MTLTFTLRTLTPSPNVLLRMHWSKRSKMRVHYGWEMKASIHARDLNAWGHPRARVRVEIARCGGRALDPDNLVGSAKILLDAMRDLHLIREDNPEAIDLHVIQCCGYNRGMRIRLSTAFNPLTDQAWP